MLRRRGSQDRLNIGKDDPRNATDFRVPKDRLHPLAPTSLPIHAKCFHGRVESNLVSVLEAIGDRPLGGEHANGDTIHLDGLNAGGE